MNSETLTVYSSINPFVNKIINKSEKEKYLRCKYWKASRHEADLFLNLYRAPVYAELHRIVLMLSGKLLKTKNIPNASEKVGRLINLYRQNEEHERFLKAKRYKAIIEAIIKDDTYPRDYIIDDVLNWSESKQLTDPNTLKIIQERIEAARKPIFKDGIGCDQVRIEIIQLCNEHKHWVFYDDANELLFPSLDLRTELIAGIESGKIVAKCSVDNSVIYFSMTPLIKWLMQHNFLSEKLMEEFRELKIASIKEHTVKYEGIFNSLHKFIQQSHDKNDILSAAISGTLDIYLKYPRNCLYWREYSTTIKSSETYSKLATKRFDGLGQLKIRKNDDSHYCQLGGLTIDMLLYGEAPEHGLSKTIPNIDFEIELVPTVEEAKYRLQPYIKISSHRLATLITDDNLVMLTDHFHFLNKKLLKDEELDIVPSDTSCSSPLEPSQNEKEIPVFIKQGETYQINYNNLTIHLPVSKGIEQIDFLLKNIHKSVSSIQLMQIVNEAYVNTEASLENFDELGEQGIVDDVFFSCGNDPVIDDQARNSYQKRLTEIAELIDESMALGDTDKVEELKDEEDDIIKHLSQDSNNKNQSRNFKNQADKAREAVNKNMTRALNKIANIQPSLHQHLKISIRIGGFCSYSPQNYLD